MVLLLNEQLPKPHDYDEMLSIAEKLLQGFPYVRVDLYNVNGAIYFGEMTFTPANGLMQFAPKEYDLLLGEKIKLQI